MNYSEVKKNKLIMQKYYDLTDDIKTSYNKIKVIDNYDFYLSHQYTIFYLNKNEDFNKFKDLWEETLNSEWSYDDIIAEFEAKADDLFDYFELGTLDIYTEKGYELEI